MKELFEALPKVTSADYILDTCFVYYVFEHQKEKELIDFCNDNSVAISSFTVEEILYHSKDVNHIVRNRLRHLIKNNILLGVIDIPVHPGNFDEEIGYVVGVDERLLHLIPDHSDAVIAALAVRIHAHLITRDKHHLFTVVLEDYFKNKGLEVKNNF